MKKCVFIDYLVRRLRQLSKGMYKSYICRNVQVHDSKIKKSLFIPIKLHSITISSVIPYTLEINSTSSSLKKKKRERGCAKERKKKRGKRKRGRESVKGKRKKMGRRRKRRKRRRETEKEREGEERRGRERGGENRISGTKNVPPSPDVFPSTKLGNNTTPMKRD